MVENHDSSELEAQPINAFFLPARSLRLEDARFWFAEYEQIEEILENYGLVELMKATTDEENDRLSKEDALEYYRSLKQQNVES